MLKYYEKQIAIPSIGLSGQKRLLETTIVIVGCGGLCAGVLPSVAGMGCSKLVLVDGDRVEESNLHRQSIHGGRVGMLKVESAKLFVLAQNKSLNVHTIDQPLTMDNAKDILREASIVFDCTDNLPTRRLISDAACSDELSRSPPPVVSGSALKLSGQILIYNIKGRDSYRTLLGSQGANCSSDQAQQDCSSAGVFGPIPQLIGHLMAVEGAKILLGRQDGGITANYNFIIYDMHTGFKTLTLKERASEPKSIWDRESYTRGIAAVDVESRSWWEMVEDPSEKLIIDVRPPSIIAEWPAPTLPQTVNIPLESLIGLLADDRKVLDMVKRGISESFHIYLFCQRGISCVRGADLFGKRILELNRLHPAACPTEHICVYSVKEGVMNLND